MADRKRRKYYSEEEDNAIRQYVASVSIDEYAISGNRLWRDMERKKVTNRTWSSMRDRYLEYLIRTTDTEVPCAGDAQCGSRGRNDETENEIVNYNLGPGASSVNESSENTIDGDRRDDPSVGNTDNKANFDSGTMLTDGYSENQNNGDSDEGDSISILNDCNGNNADAIDNGNEISNISIDNSDTREIINDEDGDKEIDVLSYDNNDDDDTVDGNGPINNPIVHSRNIEELIGGGGDDHEVDGNNSDIDETGGIVPDHCDQNDEGNVSDFDTGILSGAHLSSNVDGEDDASISGDSAIDMSADNMMSAVDEIVWNEAVIMRNVQILSGRFMATLAEIYNVLFRTNGSLTDATDYFETGYSDNYWSYEDDQVLTSRDVQAITDLALSRGVKKTRERGVFLYFLTHSNINELHFVRVNR